MSVLPKLYMLKVVNLPCYESTIMGKWSRKSGDGGDGCRSFFTIAAFNSACSFCYSFHILPIPGILSVVFWSMHVMFSYSIPFMRFFACVGVHACAHMNVFSELKDARLGCGVGGGGGGGGGGVGWGREGGVGGGGSVVWWMNGKMGWNSQLSQSLAVHRAIFKNIFFLLWCCTCNSTTPLCHLIINHSHSDFSRVMSRLHWPVIVQHVFIWLPSWAGRCQSQ